MSKTTKNMFNKFKNINRDEAKERMPLKMMLKI